jgi:hypothetical protein
MDKVLGGNQQEMAEMVHDGSDTEVVGEFDNDTSVEMQECDSVGGDHNIQLSEIQFYSYIECMIYQNHVVT